MARVDLVPIGWGEGTGGHTGCFGDVLYDCADVTRRVVIGAPRLATVTSWGRWRRRRG